MDHWSNVFPIIFLPVKVIVLGIGGYFAIKWHFDQERKLKEKAARENETEKSKHPSI